ncbi:hypothetical protein CNY67_02390 [Desulfovibrio sp. G11]|nr:hypothetical protein CNY67_02390 [Desulfovibrio sp. G11]
MLFLFFVSAITELCTHFHMVKTLAGRRLYCFRPSSLHRSLAVQHKPGRKCAPEGKVCIFGCMVLTWEWKVFISVENEFHFIIVRP